MTTPRLSTYALAQLASAAIDDVDGVVRRDGGRRGAMATFGGATPVEGVKIRQSHGRPSHVRVEIVVRYGVRIAEVAERVRRNVEEGFADIVPSSELTIDVNVSDVDITESHDGEITAVSLPSPDVARI